MKLISLFFVCSALMAATPSVKKTPSVEDEIKALDHKWAEAYVKRDIPTLQSLMSDELVTTDATGTTFLKGKQQDIHSVESQEIVYEIFKIEEVNVKAHADTAIAVGKFFMKGKAAGKDFSGRYAYTETWIKRDGQWKAIAEHITSVQ